LVRCSALGCCFILLLLSGAVSYLYTLSQYTARVQFAEVLDRERGMTLVSAVTYSANMKYFYIVFVLGWFLGILTLHGRTRLLVFAGLAAFGFYLAYSLVYLLLLNAVWLPPIPIYLEHSLFPLYMTGALAGYYGAVQVLAWCGLAAVPVIRGAAASMRRATCAAVQRIRIAAVRHGMPKLTHTLSPTSRLLGAGASQASWPAALHRVRALAQSLQQSPWKLLTTFVMGLIVAAIIPAKVAEYALTRSKPYAAVYYLRWLDEPELMWFVTDKVGLQVGEPFRGSINVLSFAFAPGFSVAAFWASGIPTVNEYSQLVTPQSLYFIHKLFQRDVRGELNGFHPKLGNSETYWSALQMLGVRYQADISRLPDQFNPGFPVMTLPHRPYSSERPEGLWYLYELPRPNVGDYSPTEVVTAQSGVEIMTVLGQANFDFTRQAVLTATISGPLVPAHEMKMRLIRGGLHVSGRSAGTSLVVLPQQFSHCLLARDPRVRLVRANLMMTGVIFAGDLDTDIIFDYGIFTPGCRWLDLADMRTLDIRIDLRMPHLSGDRRFPDWQGAWARLRAAASAIR
jgi:hypothetical protein